ncbi:MAG: hypothetical protein PHV49_05080, partial [Alistipes sp.]|nr:hypothetical protein [Alistipes sp.]
FRCSGSSLSLPLGWRIIRHSLQIYIFLLCGCGSASTATPIPEKEPEKTPEKVQQSIPLTHILICCRSSNEGVIQFKVGDQWITDHDYRNVDHARAILSTIKEAGIHTVIIDLTNPSQWATVPGSWPGCVPNEGALWETQTQAQIATIEKVCQELDMQFVMFIGNPAAHTLAYWNGIAKRIWENWAQKAYYRKYGFGDDRPMLVVFYMGEDFWKMYDAAPTNQKNYLARFHIGTCQVNSPMKFGPSDGWGYRHKSSSSDNKVRFACPNEGVAPQTWKRSTLEQWKAKVQWVGEATEYCIFGSYDDTCDAIFWGIADTHASKNAYKRYPNGEKPEDYYNVVKNYLQHRNEAK